MVIDIRTINIVYIYCILVHINYYPKSMYQQIEMLHELLFIVYYFLSIFFLFDFTIFMCNTEELRKDIMLIIWYTCFAY